MQDPTMYSHIKPQFPEQEHLKCPRCDSTHTKFCYYNNYNLSQPRHFCKNCKRYWTKGGALRNIPVGGGSRKNSKRSSSNTKRSSSASPTASSLSASTASAAASLSSSSSPSTTQTLPKQEPYGSAVPAPFDQHPRMLDVSGSFSSLLASNGGQFGNLLEGLNPNGSNLQLYGFIGNGPSQDSGRVVTGQNGTRNYDSQSLQNGSNSEGILSVPNGRDSSSWNGSNGWPDLASYAPGSNFQ